jgi:hypothetical protein
LYFKKLEENTDNIDGLKALLTVFIRKEQCMRMCLKLAMVAMALVITGCNAAFTDALLTGAGSVVSNAITALIEGIITAQAK